MKSKVIENENFEPIKIEIIIESESELVNLYHRMNASSIDVNKIYENSGNPIDGNIEDTPMDSILYNCLRELLSKKGLMK